MLIFRRTNCISTASGSVTVFRRLFITQVTTGLLSTCFVEPDGCIIFIQFCFDCLVKIYLFCLFCSTNVYVLLTVHPNIMSLFFYQLDAQILYFNTFIIFLYTFRPLLCSSSGGQIVLVQHLVSSLPLGDCSVHRLREDCSPLVNWVRHSL